jgi:hypothetical protein
MVQESVVHVGPSGHFKIKIVHSARVGWGPHSFQFLFYLILSYTNILYKRYIGSIRHIYPGSRQNEMSTLEL